MKNDVFISYSRKDNIVVNEIYDCLEENKISTFIDREDISGGDEFSPVLAEQIKASTVFLFIGSKNSYASKWTSKELHFALNHKQGIAIIPYLIDDEKLPEKLEFALADINIRNLKEHPIKERLLEDIKNAIEKLRPKDAKEDIKMAKSIADNIESSSHDAEDNIQLLMKLGEINMGRFRNAKLSEAEIYYTKAKELLESNRDKELNLNYRNFRIYENLANIKKENGKYPDAEVLYQKFIELISSSSISDNNHLIDCFISLAEVQCYLKKYDSANSNCENAKNKLVTNGIRWSTIDQAKRLVEIQIKALNGQERFEEANNVQDDILELLRNQQSNGHTTFSELLVAFADSNKRNNQPEYAKKHLEEAHSLDANNVAIMLSLAETYDTLERNTDAYEMYKKAYSSMIKQQDFSNRRYYYDLAKNLETIIAFLDKNEYYDDIDKCYQLSIAKFQLGIFNDAVNRLQIGNIYEPYADWLTSRNRFSEAKKYLNNCLDLIDSIADVNQRINNLFRVRNKIALIYYHLGLENKAFEEVKETINKTKDVKIQSADFIKSLYFTWKESVFIGFVEGANLLKKHLVEDISNVKYEKTEGQANYYTSLGWYLLQMKEFDAALKPLEEALKLEEKLKRYGGAAIANSKNNLALLYINTQQYDKAEMLLKEACVVFEKLSRKDTSTLNNIAESQNYFGQLSMAKKEYTEAEAYFEKSLKNYTKAATINKRYMKEVEDTTILLEKAKAMQD